MGDYATLCPVFRPTREEFEQPFCDYVRKIFKKQPDLAMFKVVPPRGWRPRRTPFPDLRKVQINVPIRQHVFGTKGAYRCVFVEQKPMSVADFKQAAEEDAVRLRGGSSAHGTGGGDGSAGSGLRVSTRTTSARYNRAPYDHEPSLAAQQRVPAGADGESAADGSGTGGPDPDSVDPDMERAFWSNVTLNPPMYGADTPTSFFDDKLPYGWNLQHLGDLLQNHPKVDSVPGVTTPMTYFGMWRSFFGWHKEDADLYSVNFLHWGAPKVWYSVAPSAKHKFERMAQSLFPELHRACPAFVRHKDIMLSPACLKTYGVPCMRACQRPNEFIVLNAAAYHAGFNSGFNCAEAVNFGMKEWIPVGKEAVPCRCSALKDGVRISMKLFDPKWVDPYETPSESSDEVMEKDSEEEVSAEEEQQKTVAAKRRRGGGRQASAPAAKKPRGRKPAAAAATKKGTRGKKAVKESSEGEESGSSEEENAESGDEEDEVEEVQQSTKPKRKRMPTKKAAAAAAEKAEATAAVPKGSRAPAEGAGATSNGRGKRSAATAAASAVRRAIAKSRGAADAVEPKANTSATKSAAAAAAAKRGPGRPRKAIDTLAAATVAPTMTAVAVATTGRGGRKRKADEQDKAPAEAAALKEGRGGRTRRAAAAAATTVAATGTIRKRARGGAAEATADKDEAGASGGAADGSEAVVMCTRAAVGRRAKAPIGQTEDSGAAEVKDSARSRGGRNSGRGATASTPAATAIATAMIVAAATEEPPPMAPAPVSPVEVPAAEVNSEGRLVVTAVKPRSTVEAAAMALKARINTPCQEPVFGPPMAIVGDADAPTGRRSAPAAASAATPVDKRFFFLVQRLARPAPTPGNVLLRWLKEGRDGLFRPVAGSVWEEPAGALLPVIAQAIGGGGAATAADSDSDGDASGSGADATGSSSPLHSAAGEQAAETVFEPEAWRLMTPREQIINVELRRE
ncbi:hypothetical protein Vretimale_5841 [Volvox reticuliferus]|uniref:Jumonji domain-containing protein n=1 Tax=Volvox reticuliferus TaxID=1737510 RepID=A0A8J4C7L2_9CHLO|nr:hypothetical protein Vretifemale_5738 [Volvox reticuliferus]GIM00962.1 hypothetical protein Vretimale_5841 [Volvox reticuliferus]